MEIAIYFEGGGQSAETKAMLRQGLSAFLKPLVDMARQRRCRWSVTSCGGRDQARDAFVDALQKEPDAFNILLVDSETFVTAPPGEHLEQRDGWNLAGADEEQLHLMVQCMETWLVTDPEALVAYYKQGFNANTLPNRINLEEEPKDRICAALEAATRRTQKGSYAKIKHASELLKRISHEKARARCSHCDRFFRIVTEKTQSQPE